MVRALILALLLAAAVPVRCMQLQTVFQGDLEGGVISVPQDANGSVQPTLLGEVNLAPAMRFPGGGVLDPLLFANGTGQTRPVDEETLYIRSYALGMRPTYTHALGWSLLGGGWSAGVRALATHQWNQDALDVPLGQGTYDFEEFGAGALLKKQEGPMESQLSLDVSRRDYPNFHDALSYLYGGKNYYIKDSYFWRLGIRHKDRMSDTTLLAFDLHAGERDYTDSYVVQPDGTLDLGRLQRDLNVNADLDLAWRLGARWSASLGLGYDLLSSNQNLYDQTANVYTPLGDNYGDYRLDPGLNYLAGPWSAAATYELLLRNTMHYIQDPDGDYAQGLQADTEHALTLSLERSLGRGLKLRLDLSAREVLSNQKFNHGDLAAYSYYNGGLGLAYEWE
jgi:hypothetical protein